MSSINPFIGSLQLANQIKYNYYRSEGSFLYFCNIYVTTNYDKKTFYWQAELFQWCFVFEFRTFQIFLWWQHISWPSAKSQYFLLQRHFISPAELSCISLHWSSGDCSLGFINFNIETVLNTQYQNKALMVLTLGSVRALQTYRPISGRGCMLDEPVSQWEECIYIRTFATHLPISMCV